MNTITLTPTIIRPAITNNEIELVVENNPTKLELNSGNVTYNIASPVSQVTAAENLGGHRVVTVEGYYASKDTGTDKFKVLGITTGAASIGTTATVTTFGSIEESGWNWTVGNPVFLSTNGQLTQTAPTSGFSLIVGRPKTATNLFVDISEPTILA